MCLMRNSCKGTVVGKINTEEAFIVLGVPIFYDIVVKSGTNSRNYVTKFLT